MSLDVRFVEQARRDLTALLATYPELEEDEVLRLDMIEGETNALALIDLVIAAEREALSLEEAVRPCKSGLQSVKRGSQSVAAFCADTSCSLWRLPD
jgi:hypothetical protein